jgi:hypothetical protein
MWALSPLVKPGSADILWSLSEAEGWSTSASDTLSLSKGSVHRLSEAQGSVLGAGKTRLEIGCVVGDGCGNRLDVFLELVNQIGLFVESVI